MLAYLDRAGAPSGAYSRAPGGTFRKAMERTLQGALVAQACRNSMVWKP